MHLASPHFLYFLIFIPLYVGMVWYKRKHHEAIQVSIFKDLKAIKTKKFWQFVPLINHILIITLISLFSFVLARPQGEHEKQNMSKNGIDIIIALDVSESMLAEDLTPNRIESAKKRIKEFVKGIETDRLGIIVFAGQAFTQSPLTFDYNILMEYLEQISTDSINQNVRGLNGTAVGDAILAAVNRFKKSEDRSKVLILLTDGDSNSGVPPEIAAMKANKENIKIYTIGIGKEGGAPLPRKESSGKKQYIHNPNGSLYMATFNEKTLKQVAKIGKGKYFRAGNDQALEKILQEINSLEKRQIEINTITEYSENFMNYCYALLIVFLIFIGLNAYKTLQQ